MPRAFVTGADGQDGWYLCEALLADGYEVFGLVRRSDAVLPGGAQALVGDLRHEGGLVAAVDRAQPDEVYNLAAQSFVGSSWRDAVATADVTGVGAVRLLQVAREVAPRARVFQASSSEVFGYPPTTGHQDEGTPLRPLSPYGIAKAMAHQAAVAQREVHGAFVSVGVLYNHESPRRPERFVTRKITAGVARIALGRADDIRLGTLDVHRDWGHARDTVRAMRLALAADVPEDYVVATGIAHSLRDLLDVAFGCVGIDDWTPHVHLDPRFARPSDPPILVGDASRARQRLGWSPEIRFEAMIGEMVAADLRRLEDSGA